MPGTPDFALLWLLCHRTRFEAERPVECWLERWSSAAAEEGARALDQLRGGVEQAIVELGRGFLEHRANGGLLAHLESGALTPGDYYRQILRLVYRLIFLFVAEDRELLLDPAPEAAAARERYGKHYSARRCAGWPAPGAGPATATYGRRCRWSWRSSTTRPAARIWR